MDQFVYFLIGTPCVIIALVVARWMWFRGERRKLISTGSNPELSRIEADDYGDEHDQTYSGRVINRLRARVIEGRVEILWEFNPGYIHRGFVLTAKSRNSGGSWEPVAFEPCQDSGSWREDFRYGESRSYVFTVKKTYHFFFGLWSNDDEEIVYDQISFAVRKGVYLKEKKELIRDRRELLGEVKEYGKLVAELRGMAAGLNGRGDTTPLLDDKVAKLEKRLARRQAFSQVVDTKEAEIRAHPTWTRDRENEEIEKLRDIAEEIALED